MVCNLFQAEVLEFDDGDFRGQCNMFDVCLFVLLDLNMLALWK